MLTMKQSLIDTGVTAIEHREHFSGTQERLVPLKDADISLFTPQEIELINELIAEFWDFDARRITNYSHQEFGWKMTEELQDIPYQSALESALESPRSI